MGEARRRQRGPVVCAYIHPGEVAGLFTSSLVATLLQARHRDALTAGGTFDFTSGPRIAAARNTLVRTFLSTNAEWLWMVDTDMVWKPEQFDRMMDLADAIERPIVGGLCFAGTYGLAICPTLYLTQAVDETNTPHLARLWDYPRDTVVQVDATGAAFLLVHRSVLEAMGDKWGDTPTPWFAESRHGAAEFGEDVTFCLRARTLGFPITIDTGVTVGHVKPIVVDESTYWNWRDELGEHPAASTQ